MKAPTCICIILLLVLCVYPEASIADGVFGCGGFVKSDVEINYSMVEVKLYTPHGSIKYQTDCAPNTGYYLIPLYDKGDYVLKAEPPLGWGFDPESVELKVDGENDPCSKGEDINFRFTGFSVSGVVVSAGQASGPAGVTLDLVSASKPEEKRTTVTQAGGGFAFTNVMPGDYKIKASHSSWYFSKGEMSFQVKSDNAKIGSGLVVGGYDVRGSVTGDGLPMKSVNFVLFSESGTSQVIPKCEKGAPKDFHTKETKLAPLCHVTSAEDGTFVFPVVPAGSYFLIPFYKGEHITFDVEPGKLNFKVEHGSVVLEKAFEVAGFSVSGKVLDKEKGVGIAGASVIINGQQQAVSGADGSYSLENMKTGAYTLTASLKHVSFPEMTVDITPQTPQLPNLVATGFGMCGQVVIDQVPESLGQLARQRKLIYYPEGKGSDAKSIQTDVNGAFCEMIKPGTYVVKVHLSAAESKAGLTLTPNEKVVTITNRPVLDVSFVQFRAKLSGIVKCMESCPSMEVTLEAVSRADSQMRVPTKANGKEASFSFENIMPGTYKASIVMDAWCWKNRSIDVTVMAQDLSSLEFTHTGYILKCSVSHPITICLRTVGQVLSVSETSLSPGSKRIILTETDKSEIVSKNFSHNTQKNAGSFLLDRGLNRFCLAHPGVYQVTPESCHRFDQENYTYDTSNPLTLTLTAIQHMAHGVITTDTAVPDIVVSIQSSVEDTPVTLGPLKPDVEEKKGSQAKEGSKETSQKKASGSKYSFSHWARSGETLTITAKSATTLFYPSKAEVYVSGDDCPGEVVALEGRHGAFVEGSVTPQLAGVKITVTAEDSSAEPIELMTDTSGKYRVGPLHADKKYEVSAVKDGFVMSKLDKDPMSFRAFKLGEISVQMLDEAGQPLPSVLLSLSGDRQYRSNNVTGQNGHMTFTGLSPGQYFLRPMMKEYRFEPASQMINVQEGTTEKISIKGSRVAFSCFGRVTSLNGEPESGVIIEALGEGACAGRQEESTTETDGSYRIRGLEPSCVFDLHTKAGDVNTHIERTVPTSRKVKVENADLHDINIIAFRRMNQMDVSGNVRTESRFLSSLKVRLINEAQPDSPVHSAALGKSTFFFLPSLPMDGKTYVLTLESSLSKLEYEFQSSAVEFVANKSHRHFTFAFEPKPRAVDQDVNQGSLLVLPILGLLAALVYNYRTVVPYLLNFYQQLMSAAQKSSVGVSLSSSSPSSSPSSAGASAQDIPIPAEFLGSEASPVKRKTKPRKAQ